MSTGPRRHGWDWSRGPSPEWVELMLGADVREKVQALAARTERELREAMFGGPWAEAKWCKLLVKDASGFGCRNLPRFAVALADLDCRLRVFVPSGWYREIAGGRISGPAVPTPLGGRGKYCVIPPGRSMTFRVVGPDAEAALPVIRETFARGTEGHLAVLRRYARLQEARESPNDGTQSEGSTT